MSKEQREQAIEKIANILWKRFEMEQGDAEIDAAIEILATLESLGYIQSKPSVELEQAITELAKNFLFFKKQATIDNIRSEIENFLSANHLVQLDEDQSLPENPHIFAMDRASKVYSQAQQDMLNDGFARFKKVRE